MFKQIVLSKVLNNEKNDKYPQIKSNKNESSVASLLEQQTHLSHLFSISILLINGFMYFDIYLIFFSEQMQMFIVQTPTSELTIKGCLYCQWRKQVILRHN